MAFSRYTRAPVLGLGFQYGTSRAIEAIRTAMKNGTLRGKEIVVRGAERLDTIAAVHLGDGRYWWVLAATSNIGWGMQVPPGTIVVIPSLADIAKIVG